MAHSLFATKLNITRKWSQATPTSIKEVIQDQCSMERIMTLKSITYKKFTKFCHWWFSSPPNA